MWSLRQGHTNKINTIPLSRKRNTTITSLQGLLASNCEQTIDEA